MTIARLGYKEESIVLAAKATADGSKREYPSRVWALLSASLMVFLPVCSVISTALAAAHKGWVKVALICLVVTITACTSALGLAKDRRASKARAKAVAAIANLDTAVTGAGQPLVLTLGRVTSEDSLAALDGAVHQLRQMAIMAAVMQCGKSDGECRIRGVYYQLRQGRLDLVGDPIGRPASRPPRKSFKATDGKVSRRVIETAKGKKVVRFSDVTSASPEEFEDYEGREYETLIAAPVWAADDNFGILIVDSDRAGSLSEADAEYVNMLANILGAGLAHQRAITKILPAVQPNGNQHGPNGLATPKQRVGELKEVNEESGLPEGV